MLRRVGARKNACLTLLVWYGYLHDITNCFIEVLNWLGYPCVEKGFHTPSLLIGSHALWRSAKTQDRSLFCSLHVSWNGCASTLARLIPFPCLKPHGQSGKIFFSPAIWIVNQFSIILANNPANNHAPNVCKTQSNYPSSCKCVNLWIPVKSFPWSVLKSCVSCCMTRPLQALQFLAGIPSVPDALPLGSIWLVFSDSSTHISAARTYFLQPIEARVQQLLLFKDFGLTALLKCSVHLSRVFPISWKSISLRFHDWSCCAILNRAISRVASRTELLHITLNSIQMYPLSYPTTFHIILKFSLQCTLQVFKGKYIME